MTGVRVFHEDGTWSYREESAERLVRMTLDQYEAALATARREARAQALEEAAREIGDLRGQTLRLHLGEMTPQESRTCGALMALAEHCIRALIAKPDARP